MMLVRAEEPADIAGIRHVVEEAFLEALEAWLVDQLRADGSYPKRPLAPDAPFDASIRARRSRHMLTKLSLDLARPGHELEAKSVVDHREAA